LKPRTHILRLPSLLAFLAGVLLFAFHASAQPVIDENCTVSVLNRVSQVDRNGHWVVQNVPSNQGYVRAHVTCTHGGVTRVGQSGFFLIATNGLVSRADFTFERVGPAPSKLTLTAPSPNLPTIGTTVQLSAVVDFVDAASQNVTASSQGTSYTTSNPAIATVSAEGQVTAVGGGSVIVSAFNDGSLGLLRIFVGSSVDNDGDGVPDEWETANGFDPNNPADGAADPDADGLTNLQEYQITTNPHLRDTDGDGVSDGLEITTGSNPIDRWSFNLARALRSVAVSPPAATLKVNPFRGDATQQLTVTGTLLDNTTLDITGSARGTTYTVNSPTVVNFGPVQGRLYGVATGSATVQVNSNGFVVDVPVTVTTFNPSALSVLSLPGYANNVAVRGSHAFIAAGSAGLQVVDVSDPDHPAITGSLALPGDAIDIRIRGTLAFIAAGTAGLQIVDITDPIAPLLVGSASTNDYAQDVWVDGNYAYLTNVTGGLQIIDVTTPASPVQSSVVAIDGEAKGVSVSGSIAAVATSTGLVIIDVTDPAAPVLLSEIDISGDPKDVEVRGTFAYVGSLNGLQIVDISKPAEPVLSGNMAALWKVRDLAFLGDIALFAAESTPAMLPWTDVTNPASPGPNGSLSLDVFGNYGGTGIATDSHFVYLTAQAAPLYDDSGSDGNTVLIIARHDDTADTAGVAPVVSIASPLSGQTLFSGTVVTAALNAADDVAVESASVFAGGRLVASELRAPFTTTFTVPAGVTSLTIGATATDFGGNTGSATEITVTVSPAPDSTVRGFVRNSTGTGIAGARVTVAGQTGQATTDATGAYEITGVATAAATLTVHAFAHVGALDYVGDSAPTAPVRGGVTTIGVTVASPPFFSGSLAINGFANAVEVRGRTAVIAAGSGGVQFVDVTDVTAPRLAGVADIGGTASDVALDGTHAVVADLGAAVHVIDFADPAQPSVLGTLYLNETARSVAVRQGFAFVTGQYHLIVVDIHDPANPVQVATLSMDGPRAIAITRALAVITESPPLSPYHDTRSAVAIVDISVPGAPVRLGDVTVPGTPRDVFIRGNIAYVAAKEGGLQRIDFSDPAHPLLLAELQNDFTPSAVAVRGDHFIAAGQRTDDGAIGLMVDNTVNPPAPTATSMPGGLYRGNAVALFSTYAAITAEFDNSTDLGTSGNTRLFLFHYPARVDDGGSSPVVAVTSPPAGSLVQGDVVSFEVTATDDQGVDAVTLLVNGQPFGTEGMAPYRFPVQIASGATSLTVSARATDFGENTATAANVTYTVIPDPLTTISGIVRDENGQLAANISVTVAGRQAVTGANGAYSFTGVPTITGNFVVTATNAGGETPLRGVSVPVAPVRGGTTVVPAITVLRVSGVLSSLVIPGHANSVAVRGRTAFVAAGAQGLQVVDFTSVLAPQIAGAAALPSTALRVAVSGTRAYVLTYDALHVIDVSVPASPTLLGTISVGGSGMDLAVRGTTAYITRSWGGLMIVDASNPADPVLAGYASTPGSARSVDLSGPYAVVAADGYDNNGYADYSTTITIHDVRDPANVSTLSTLTVNGFVLSVIVHGSIAYLTTIDNGIQLVDFSDPASPVLLPEIESGLGYFDAAMRGGRLLATGSIDDNGAVRVFNAATPSNPGLLDQFDLPTANGSYVGTSIALVDDFAVVTGDAENNPSTFRDEGDTRLFFAKYFATLDQAGVAPAVSITAPAGGATVIGGTVVPVHITASDDVLVDSVTLLVDGHEELVFGAAPFETSLKVPVGASSMTFGATAIDLGGNTGTAQNVTVSVIPDPGTTVTGLVRDTGGALVPNAAVTVRDEHTTTDGSGRYTVTGIPTIEGNVVVEAFARINGEPKSGTSTPAQPLPQQTTNVADITLQPLPVGVLTSLGIPGFANAVAVQGDLAAVAAGAEGLQLVDLTNPLQPAIAGAQALAGVAGDVKLASHYAYLATMDGGLQIVDITDPANPQLRGSTADGGTARALALSGSTVYLAAGSDGLKIIDASDPQTPVVLGTVALTYANAVDAAGSIAVVVDAGIAFSDTSRVSIVDASTPASASEVGFLVVPGIARSVVVRGTTAFVATDQAVLSIDIANPAAPQLAGQLAHDNFYPSALAGAGTELFEAGYDNASHPIVPVIDAAVPSTLARTATVPFNSGQSSYGTDVTALHELVLMTAQNGWWGNDIQQWGSTTLSIAKYRNRLPGDSSVRPAPPAVSSAASPAAPASKAPATAKEPAVPHARANR
jgi:hypothetical protein